MCPTCRRPVLPTSRQDYRVMTHSPFRLGCDASLSHPIRLATPLRYHFHDSSLISNSHKLLAPLPCIVAIIPTMSSLDQLDWLLSGVPRLRVVNLARMRWIYPHFPS